MIPNIIHMMYFFGPKSREFSFINYLAVRAARDVQKPDAFYFYYNEEPKNNPHWEAIKPYVTLVQMEPPTEWKGVPLEYPQYQADIVRLQKLQEHGGIYLDTDTLLLKPLPMVFGETTRGEPCVMSMEGDTSLNAGLILARPRAYFMQRWLDRIEIGEWAHHSVNLPYQLWLEDPEAVFVLPKKEFIPFDFREKYIFGNDPADLAKIENSYAIHVWETWRKREVEVLGLDYLAVIDNDYLLTSDSLFAKLFSKYATKPKPLKICVYTIAKNEEHFVERYCNSAKDADLVLIADTGSSDNTVAEALRCGASVHNICITPWRFDLARNASLALIPREMDVCICMDMDEILEPGWREEVEKVWKKETTRLGYYFDWGCGIKFRYEKIHARHGYMWHHPCHEYPIPDGRIKEVWAETPALLVSHHPDPTKSRGQYLDLLEVSVKEDPDCPRNAFYYARELSFHGKWQIAIDAINNYLKLPRATWCNERCYAYRVMGKCYEELGNRWEAENAYHRACAESPNTREPWCNLATLYYRQSRWPQAYAAAMRALEIKDRELVYTCDPEVWGHQPHDMAAIAAHHMGLKEMAIWHGQKALQHSPDDRRLKVNLEFYAAPFQEAAE